MLTYLQTAVIIHILFNTHLTHTDTHRIACIAVQLFFFIQEGGVTSFWFTCDLW